MLGNCWISAGSFLKLLLHICWIIVGSDNAIDMKSCDNIPTTSLHQLPSNRPHQSSGPGSARSHNTRARTAFCTW